MAVVLHIRSNSVDNVKKGDPIHVETKKMRDSAEKCAQVYTIGSCSATNPVCPQRLLLWANLMRRR